MIRSNVLGLALLGFALNLFAVDGVVLIDQNRALAGSVTPGDTPGFPVTLSVAGTYRLTGNLTVPDANANAILITADGVTIDLNGFSIIGPSVCPIGGVSRDPPPASPTDDTIVASCAPTGTGIGIKAGDIDSGDSAGPTYRGKVGIRVTNGTISGMGGFGMILGPGGQVENVTARSNGATGIVTARGSIVKNNVSLGNGDKGYFIGNASYTVGNTASLNHGDGFEIGSGLFIQNVSLRNGGFGASQFGDLDPHIFANNSLNP